MNRIQKHFSLANTKWNAIEMNGRHVLSHCTRRQTATKKKSRKSYYAQYIYVYTIRILSMNFCCQFKVAVMKKIVKPFWVFLRRLGLKDKYFCSTISILLDVKFDIFSCFDLMYWPHVGHSTFQCCSQILFRNLMRCLFVLCDIWNLEIWFFSKNRVAFRILKYAIYIGTLKGFCVFRMNWYSLLEENPT